MVAAKLVVLQFNILCWVEITRQSCHWYGERRLFGKDSAMLSVVGHDTWRDSARLELIDDWTQE